MQKILVCHTGAWIGDMVMLTPSLRALKRAFPESCLVFLLRQNVAEMMNTNPYVDKCIVDSKTDGRLQSFSRLVRKIREFQFDMAVILHPTSVRNILLPFLAGVPIRVGSNYRGRDIFLTHSCQNKTDIHEVERYLNVIESLDNNTAQLTDDFVKKQNAISTNLEYWHTDEERQSVQALLSSEGILSNDRFIAINVGTTWQTKQWDLINFSQVISELSDRIQNYKIILTGSSSETAYVKDIKLSNMTINLIGKTDILQLGALLEMCDVCLTCDSGPMHIAAAVGTPTVALFGPTAPNRHRPYGEEDTIIEKPVPCRPCYKRTCHRQDTQFLCMKEITTAEVVQTLVNKLDQ